MRKTVHKVFLLWQFEQEEQWLNDMAAQGWALTSVGFCSYAFESCQPGEYRLRLEMLENSPGHEESRRYIAFLEETGAEYLGSILKWVYFRKKAQDGEFDLYSDNASRVKHLNRILVLCGLLTLMELFSGLNGLLLFSSSGGWEPLGIAICCLLFAALLGYGWWRLSRKKQKLQKERRLFE